MSPQFYRNNILFAALDLLPSAMGSPPAIAMCIAIALQESRLKHRHQVGGPARSYSQFEVGGVRGVLSHQASAKHIQSVLEQLDYPRNYGANECYNAIEHNDILGAAFTRLLLYTLPDELPAKGRPDVGWNQYLKAWRPGKPHRETWDAAYAFAWTLAEGENDA